MFIIQNNEYCLALWLWSKTWRNRAEISLLIRYLTSFKICKFTIIRQMHQKPTIYEGDKKKPATEKRFYRKRQMSAESRKDASSSPRRTTLVGLGQRSKSESLSGAVVFLIPKMLSFGTDFYRVWHVLNKPFMY